MTLSNDLLSRSYITAAGSYPVHPLIGVTRKLSVA